MPFDRRPEWIDEKIITLGERGNIPDYLDKIKSACNDKVAQLFVDGRSFVVLRPEKKDGVTQIWLWLAWSDTGCAAQTFLPELKELALFIGAERIQFQTPFPGVVRLSRKVGWQLVQNKPNDFIMEIRV